LSFLRRDLISAEYTALPLHQEGRFRPPGERRGKALVTTRHSLGQYLLMDYVDGKTRHSHQIKQSENPQRWHEPRRVRHP
jgi:hypothetical protein